MREIRESSGEQGILEQLSSLFNGKVAAVLAALSLAGCGGRFYTADMNPGRVFAGKCSDACDDRYTRELADDPMMTYSEKAEADEVRRDCRKACWKLGGYD